MTTANSLRSIPAWAWLLALAVLHLLLAWPGAGERGIIAEEVQPYLHHYPIVVDGDRRLDEPARPWPPHAEDSLEPRWIGTGQWPVLAWQGRDRIWPVFVRGHQTALGSWWGIALAPLLGEGIAGVRRSSVLLGLILVLLLAAIARRSGLDPPGHPTRFVALAGLLCVLSPGLWFFTRTGYGFELASRVFMLAALAIAARRTPIDRGRGVLLGLCVAAAILSRATIAVTLAPALILLLVDPRRWPGPVRFVWPGVLGVALPIALVGAALATLPFWSGTTPAADLPIAALAGRTLVAPLCAFVQLAWVVDPRLVLTPLVEGSLEVDLVRGVIPALLGAAVFVAALVRWWRGRSRDGERMFVAALLANSLVGAWLYGDPGQFQLAMALEPLFALALAEQLADLWRSHRALAQGLTLALILARATSLAMLWQSEHVTANPMLSGRAQRAVVAELERLDPARVLTTDYNHAGVFEAWTNERMHPVHGWPLLGSRDRNLDRLQAGFGSILDGFAICHVLFSVGDNLVAGEFSEPAAAGEGLARALAERERSVIDREVFVSEAGTPAFELWSLSGCD